MVPNIEAQFISLVMSVFAGLIIGLLFDLYRTINYYSRPSKAFLYFMDLLFWIITFGVVFVILLNADYAKLRVYTFGGMGIGMLIYFKLFSQYMLKFYRSAAYVIGKTLRLSLIAITLPFRFLYTLLWFPVHYIIKTIKAGINAFRKGLASTIKKIISKK